MSNTQTSKILNKLKSTAKGAWNRSRKKEAKPRGGGGLPPNLKNIVAACQSYKLAETTKGDPYYSLTAIIKDPEELTGRRATFMWFINETDWSTVEDALDQLSNDLQLLGEEMPEDVGDVVDVLASLCERGVHLLFNTGGPPKPGKNVKLFIQGLADDWPDEPQEGAGVTPERRSGNKPGKAGKQEVEPEPDPNDAGGDAGGSNGTGNATEEPWVPAKGDLYGYTPKGSKSTIKVEVMAVDAKKKTFDLKGGKPPKMFKAIKWWNDKEETDASVSTWED